MNAAHPAIAAVLIDADGVIQRPSAGWRESLAALCADAARGESFLAELFAAERRALDGREALADTLAPLLARWGCASPLPDVLRLLSQIDTDPAALELVAELRRGGTTVALASNQHPFRAAFMSDGLGYAARFDQLFYSCALGHAKPSHAYFAAALDRLALPAGAVLFVDDHEENVGAAREVGLHAEVATVDTLQAVLARYGLPRLSRAG